MSGSAWEREIGTERLQDKGNNVLGDDGEINQVQIHECSQKRGPQKCIYVKKFLKILDFRSVTFKNCNFTTVKTRFLKMCGFGAKSVLAKTWGFKGAKIKSFGNSGCPL